MAKERVGLGPSTFRSGDGFLDDKTVVFSNVHFVDDFKYREEDTDEQLTLCVDMTPEDGDTSYTQNFTLGKTAQDNFGINKDKVSLFVRVDGKSITGNSKYGKFMTSLINAGFPESDLDDGVDSLNDVKAHIRRETEVLKINGKEVPVDYMLVEKVFLDGDSAGKSKNGKPTAAQVKQARGFLVTALEKKPQMDIDEAFKRVSRLVMKDDDLEGDEEDAITKLIQDTSFLEEGADAKKWGFDGDTISAN